MPEICEMNYVDRQFPFHSDKISTEVCIFLVDQKQAQNVYEIKVFLWTEVFYLKKMVANLQSFCSEPSQLRLIYKNTQLENDKKTLSDYNVCAGSTIIIKKNDIAQRMENGLINAYRIFQEENLRINKLLKDSEAAINEGNIPMLISEGTSGSYIIENRKNQKISIFKPSDEEVNAPNNPRGYNGFLGSDGIHQGILSGECATREVATFLLDSQKNNYHDVPVTTYIQFFHPQFSKTSKQFNPKQGSLQKFVFNDGIAGDFGSKKFPVAQIHKIALLDIRILNCDRNDGNILVQEKSDAIKLIPIDHGLSFPDSLEIYEESIVWMSYSQAKIPFSQQQLDYISELNPLEDVKMLSQKLGFRQICLRNIRLAGIFLQKTATYGYNLYQIGKMIYISEQNSQEEAMEGKKHKRSKFQELVIQAENLYMDMCQNQKQYIIPELDSSSSEQKQDSQFETTDSWKNLSLKKKISLPTLKKRNTSYHQTRKENRKKMQGINGIKKTIWKKYSNQSWTELFYHYFQDLLQNYLEEKIRRKRSEQIKKACNKENITPKYL